MVKDGDDDDENVCDLAQDCVQEEHLKQCAPAQLLDPSYPGRTRGVHPEPAQVPWTDDGQGGQPRPPGTVTLVGVEKTYKSSF